jgi:hypothetical protein
METAPVSVSDDISPPKQNEPANVAKANKPDGFEKTWRVPAMNHRKDFPS